MPPTAVAFGLTLWQLEYRPRAQNQHVPQKTLNGTMTRSPGRRSRTSGPTSSTTPMKLVPERRPGPGVGHHPVVEVQVRPADGRHGDPDDGVARMLDPRSVLLFDPNLVRPAIHHRISVDLLPGSLVVCYTDGLVERRHTSIDDRLDQLRASVHPDSPELVCAQVMNAMVGGEPADDDVALVVLHRTA